MAFGALTACGASGRTQGFSRAQSDAGAENGGSEASAGVASFEAIAARGSAEAPLMRESSRFEGAPRTVELKADRDACFRVTFAASSTVRARIEDDAQSTRGVASEAANAGIAPLRGPACAKKGEALRLVLDAPAGTFVRAIVWQSP